MYTTYIIHSKTTGRFYTGHCEDVDVRMIQHNSGRNISTKSGVPWELIFRQQFESRWEAMKAESSIKKRGAKRFLSDHNIPIG